MKKAPLCLLLVLCILLPLLASCENSEDLFESSDSTSIVHTTDNESELSSIEDASEDNSIQEESENITSEISDTTSVEGNVSDDNIDAEAIVAEVYERFKTFKDISECQLKYKQPTDEFTNSEYYGIVDDKRFKTLDDIRTFISTLFPINADYYTNKLFEPVEAPGISEPATYIEHDNTLYMIKGEYKAGYIFFGYWDYEKAIIKLVDNNTITVSVPVYTVPDSNVTSDFDFIITYNGTNWSISDYTRY